MDTFKTRVLNAQQSWAEPGILSTHGRLVLVSGPEGQAWQHLCRSWSGTEDPWGREEFQSDNKDSGALDILFCFEETLQLERKMASLFCS